MTADQSLFDQLPSCPLFGEQGPKRVLAEKPKQFNASQSEFVSLCVLSGRQVFQVQPGNSPLVYFGNAAINSQADYFSGRILRTI